MVAYVRDVLCVTDLTPNTHQGNEACQNNIVMSVSYSILSYQEAGGYQKIIGQLVNIKWRTHK